MSIESRLNRRGTLHVYVEGGRDQSSGDYIAGTFPADRERRIRCDLRKQSSTERRTGGSVTVINQWVIFIDKAVPSVSALDEVTVAGEGRYKFQGDPWLVRNPRTTRATHWEGFVEKVN